jgi:biotin transport system ATP-binding protein
MSIIEIQGLTHRFAGSGKGIHDIDLTIEAGELVVVAGANGSGKTTLLRHLNGLLIAQQGTVRVDGDSVARDPARARRKVGMVFQDADSQIVGETVAEDVAFGPENLGLDKKEIESRVAGALAALDLTDLARQAPHLLSGGEKRRLAIAGVLAMEPEIVVFDEPFSNLDYPATCQVLSQILALHRGGRTMIIATHDLEKIIAHASRLVLMNQGKVVSNGSPDALMGQVERFGVRSPCSWRMGRPVASWLN